LLESDKSAGKAFNPANGRESFLKADRKFIVSTFLVIKSFWFFTEYQRVSL